MKSDTSGGSGDLGWLGAFPQLAAIDDPAWLQVVRQAQAVTIPEETVVIHNGTSCQNFLLLRKGTMRVQQVSESGREIVLYRIGPGDISILALTSLVDGGSYPAEAATETEVQAYSIALPSFRQALAASEGFRNFVLDTLARHLREVIVLVEDIAFQRLDVRLADMLCQEFRKRNAALIDVTHEELAKDLGTTREVVSRLLKDFEKTKACVRLHRGRIELVSPECLAQCAKKGFMHFSEDLRPLVGQAKAAR